MKLTQPPVGRRQVPFIVAMLIDALGSGMFTPFSLLYFAGTTRLGVTTIGAAVSTAVLLSVPFGLVCGSLVDRLGGQRVAVAATAGRAVSFALYPLVHSAPLLFLAVTLSAFGDRAYWVTHVPMLKSIVPAGELGRWLGTVSAARSLGLAGGAVLGGLAASLWGRTGFHALALLNAASFALAAVLLAVPSGTAWPAKGEPVPGTWRTACTDLVFLGVVLVKLVFVVCGTMLVGVLPLYLVRDLGWPAWAAGTVFSANCLLVAGTQPFVAIAAERRRPAPVIATGGLLYAGAAAGFLLSAGLGPLPATVCLAIAVGVYSTGQMLVTPTADALSGHLPPDRLHGRYQSVYQLSWSLGQAVAPALGTALFARGAGVLWLGFAGLAVLASGLIGLLNRQLGARVGPQPVA